MSEHNHVLVLGGGGREGDLGGQELKYCHWLCHTGQLGGDGGNYDDH